MAYLRSGMTWLLRASLVVAAVSCGGKDIVVPPIGVGPDGDSLSFLNGVITVVVPESALTQQVTISATLTSNVPASSTLLAGGGVDLTVTPDVTFSRPVVVRVQYQHADLPAGVRESELGVYRVNGNAWTPFANATIDTVANVVTINLTTFSVYGIMGAQVASVTVAPGTPSIQVGSATNLTATVRDAGNNLLPDRTVTWQSNATGTATVTPGAAPSHTATVNAIAAGTATITATSDGVNGTSTVTVTAQPPPGPHNEPAGYTLIADRPFNAVATCSNGATREAGWDDVEGCPQINGGNFTIINDPTAPFSAGNVAQMRYPLGFNGGSSPALAQRFWSTSLGYREIYMRYWMKLSSSFEGHQTSTNKIFHLWIGNPAGNRVFDRIVGTDQGPLDYQLALQGTPAAETRTRLIRNRAGTTAMNRNQWYKVEIQIIANTPGQSNGIARAWIDGQLAIEYTDVQIVGTGESPVWSQVQWSPTWGGGGDVATVLFFMWLDHTYISAKQ